MKFVTSAIVMVAILLGCSSDDNNNPSTGPGVNHAPVIRSLTANPDTITARNEYLSKAVLVCIATDIDKDYLTYAWQSANPDGYFVTGSSAPSVTWACRDQSNTWIKVTVSDGIEFLSDSVIVVAQ